MNTTKKICIAAAAVALFVCVTFCLQVPVFENYYLCLGYIVMEVCTFAFGTVTGVISGSAGVICYCLLTGGLRGMPGWAAGNVVIGLGLGLLFSFIRKTAAGSTAESAAFDRHAEAGRKAAKVLLWAGAAVIITVMTAVGILGVKSVTESILYAQPFMVRVLKNMNAFIADAAVLLAALPLAAVFGPKLRKMTFDRNAEMRTVRN